MLLAQLSDLHLTAGRPGDAAAAGLAAAVTHLTGLETPVDAVLITGDLTDDGAAESYVRLQQILAPLEASLHVIPGNHDDRAHLAAAFGIATVGGYVQGVAHVGELALVLCDSAVVGSDAGAFGDGRLEWLDRELAGLAPGPVVVAIHHPPFVTGITEMDAIGLADAAAFCEVISAHAHVQAVLSGHIHRVITGRAGHAPAIVCPSTFSQLELNFRPEAAIGFGAEPAGMMLHRFTRADGLASHLQPIGPW